MNYFYSNNVLFGGTSLTFYGILLVLLSSVPENVDSFNCSIAGGAYYKVPWNVTCCANYTEQLAPFSLEYPDSSPRLDKYDEYITNTSVKCSLLETSDDLPTATWKYLDCLLKKEKNFDIKSSFESFLDFMTRNYTAEVKDQIKQSGITCQDALAETEGFKRLEKFTNCFYQAEHKVCHKPYKETHLWGDEQENTVSHKDYCKPTENFPHYGELCCNGKNMAFHTQIMDMLSQFALREDYYKSVKACMESYEQRYSKLSPKESNQTKLYCDAACAFTSNKLYSESSMEISWDLIKDKIFVHYPSAVKEKLVKITKESITSRKYIVPQDEKNRNMTMEELNIFMKTQQEPEKIRLFCGFYDSLIMFWRDFDVALEQYCFDKKYVDANFGYMNETIRTL